MLWVLLLLLVRSGRVCCCLNPLEEKKKHDGSWKTEDIFQIRAKIIEENPFFIIFHFIFASYKRGTLLVPCQNVSKISFSFSLGIILYDMYSVLCTIYKHMAKEKGYVCV
jgi:hypothetical protein